MGSAGEERDDMWGTHVRGQIKKKSENSRWVAVGCRVGIKNELVVPVIERGKGEIGMENSQTSF
jgi:hypothetical protein